LSGGRSEKFTMSSSLSSAICRAAVSFSASREMMRACESTGDSSRSSYFGIWSLQARGFYFR
jgi:hypothetical protein